MACHDPDCPKPADLSEFYCRRCGEMTHAICTCSCYRTTCPHCGYNFDPSLLMGGDNG